MSDITNTSVRSVQDNFLNQARKSQAPVAIHVTNGFLIKDASIKAYDNYAILIETGGKQMMVYKHAISTITMSEPIDK